MDTSAPTTETGLALAAVDFGEKYMWVLDQVRVWAVCKVPTAHTETYPEVSEGLLGRKGLSVAHRGDNDTDSRGLSESSQTTSETETQPHLSAVKSH